jgi:hypothetical protein
MNFTAASVILSLDASPTIAMRRPYHIIRKFIFMRNSHANIGTHFQAHLVNLCMISSHKSIEMQENIRRMRKVIARNADRWCTHIHCKMASLIDNFGNNLGSTRTASDDSNPFSRKIVIIVPMSGVPGNTCVELAARSVTKFRSIKRTNALTNHVSNPVLILSSGTVYDRDVPYHIILVPDTTFDETFELCCFIEAVLASEIGVI